MPVTPGGGSGRSGRVTRLEESWIRGSKFVRPASTLPSRKKRSHVARGAAADPRRDSRLHQMLKQASGTKPLGLRTFASTQSLRRPPAHTNQQQQPQKQQQTDALPVPRLDIATLRRHHKRTKTPNIHAASNNLLSNAKPFFDGGGGGSKTPASLRSSSSYAPSSSTRMWTEREHEGPSTLRRKVDAGKRSEWARIVSADLENYRSEQTYVKQAKRRAAKQYADEIRRTIDLRATKNNPDVEKRQKLQWSQVLQQEQSSNDVVRRAQAFEDKRRAAKLKRDRDVQVAQIHARRAQEKAYHDEWNAKIVADAQESVALGAAARAKKSKQERQYILSTIQEHKKAKAKIEAAERAKREEEERLVELHNAHTKGQYVTEGERRKREFHRIDAIQTRQMQMGERWVGADARKRQREQRQFEGMIDGGATARARGGPKLEGAEAEVYAARLMREKKKRAMADRRRDLLKQMVAKKERKMKERVREADFALRAAGDSVKTGMYVAYEVEAKAKKKADYARALKKQMNKSIARKRANPEGIAARMTEAERTLNSGLLSQLGISGEGEGDGRDTAAKKNKNKSKKRSIRGRGSGGGGGSSSGGGPTSQVFLGTYDDVKASDSYVPRLNSNRSSVKESPFAVEAGAKFEGYRRSVQNSAHAVLMKSGRRPGTSDASMYSSLRAGGVHHPRKSKSWFDDE